jgi:release factor glutamine methyltransferase
VPSAQITAVDASADALRIARANSIAHRLADRIRFVEGAGFGALGETLIPFNLIVSNPPYIPTAEIGELDPEVRDHDPRLALDGGPDGLDCYRELARTALPWLKPGCPLLLECGDDQTGPVADLFRSAGWLQESIEKDLSGRDRVLIVARPRG